MLRYWLCLVGVSSAVIIIVGSICAHKYWHARDLHDDPSLGQILRFQYEKVENLAPNQVDTVLIGDSSLGNAISAKQLDSELGIRSMNLALTGSFSFAGGRTILDRIREKTKIKNVVFFYTPDAMARGNNEGLFFAGGSMLTLDAPFRTKIDVGLLYLSRLFDIKAAFRFLTENSTASEPLPSRMYENDYLVVDSKIRLDSSLVTGFRMPSAFDSTGPIYLKSLSTMCRSNDWNCLYVHGTMIERLSSTPATLAFIRLSNEYLRNSESIRLVADDVIGIPDEDRGDTIYHVNWKLRDKYTHILADRLRPFLRRTPPPATPSNITGSQ